VYNSLVSALLKLCNGEQLEFIRPSKKFIPAKPRPPRKNKKSQDQEEDVNEDEDIVFEDEEDVNNEEEDVNMEDEEDVNYEEEDVNNEEEQVSKRRRVEEELTQPQHALDVYYNKRRHAEEEIIQNALDLVVNNVVEPVVEKVAEPVVEKVVEKKPVPLAKKTFTLASAPYLKSMLPSSTTNAPSTTNASSFEKWEPKTIDRTLSVRLKSGVVMKYADWKRSNKNRKPDNYDINESYVEFQQSNGEWVDLESYYIKFIKDVNNENMEGKSFECICAKYKYYRDNL
jgi:hypothetical protein